MTTYTHATVPCAVLDARAHLPSEEQLAQRAVDVWDVYRIQARKAQIHLEMRMELLRIEEQREPH